MEELKSYCIEDGDEISKFWTVTFIYKGQYVETPYFKTSIEALAYAVEKIRGA